MSCAAVHEALPTYDGGKLDGKHQCNICGVAVKVKSSDRVSNRNGLKIVLVRKAVIAIKEPEA